MKFGDYLKQQRENMGWTQPEAATRAGIEQSYLSKLETGKSYPSGDVYERLAQIFRFDAEQMSEQVYSAELDKLREVKQVRQAVLAYQKSERRFARQWLIATVVLSMIGGASLGLIMVETDQETQVFYYRSLGVLEPGEDLRAYDIVHGAITSYHPDYESLKGLRDKMIERMNEDYKTMVHYKGKSFVEKVEGGRRAYRLYDDKQVVTPSPLRWLLVPALMCLIGAIGCFLVSFRWR